MSLNNRLGNSGNKFQGDRKRVLAVCSAGLLRSPTIAWVLSNSPYNYNTRAAGVEPEYALIPVDEALVFWADEIVCAEPWQKDRILEDFKDYVEPNTVFRVLNLPDRFKMRDPELVELIKERYDSPEGE